MNNKIIMITAFLAVMVSMAGNAAAEPFDLNVVGSTVPIELAPGDSITLDLAGTNFGAADIESGTMFPLSAIKSCITPGCDTSKVIVSFATPNFGPAAGGTVTNTGILTITLDPGSPLNTEYNIQILAGSDPATGASIDIGVNSVEDPVLWVVPDNPTRYSSTNPDPLLSETVVEDASMGTTFSGNVIVLNQESPQLKNGQHIVAYRVHLKFFVHDASNINDITIGTAQRIKPGSPPIVTDNPGSDPVAKTLLFQPVAPNPSLTGYGVDYLIGDIPFSGGPSLTGDPEVDLNNFNPNNAEYYIKVPFTVHFKTPPEPGFVLYAYAKNLLIGKFRAKTAFSHDGGFFQIPEFPTVALPVVAVIGLVFFFHNRKKKGG